MAIYTIRPGDFTIEQNNIIYVAGEEVDLSEHEFELHKHKLEGTESSIVPIDFGNLTSNFSSYPKPYINNWNNLEIFKNNSKTFPVEGSFFTPNMTVSTEAGAVEIEFIDSHKIILTIVGRENQGSHDLIFDNGKNTILVDAISILDRFFEIVDLRLGGTEFPDTAIEMREGMSFSRTPEGMIFAGQRPWRSWARFVGEGDRWVWNRSKKRSLSWIYQNSNFFMLGIGSFANDPTSTVQYYQAEIVSYNPASSVQNLYGNNGTQGSGIYQSFSVSKNSQDIIKIVLNKNGENGAIFEAYRLSNSDDWLDNSNKLGELTIAGFGSDEPEIMPFVIPQDGNTTKLLGFILEEF